MTASRTSRFDASRLIDVIDRRIRRKTRSLAMVETTWGPVADVDEGESTVDVYLYGSPYASEGFRIIGGGMPEIGDNVKAAIDRTTGDRWIMEPIIAVADGEAVSHDSISGVSADDHHAQVHTIDGGDHTGTLDAEDIDFVPFGSIAATNVQDAIEEAYTEAIAGGVTDHGALTGLSDDDHPQYATNTEFDDHSARHESGGADALATTINIPFIIDGGGSVITTGIKGDLGPFAFAFTITEWTVLSTDGTSGAIVVDVWADSYANFPPVVGDSITTSEKPTITATSDKGQDTSLNSGAGWSVSAGSILRYNVDSVTSLKRVQIMFKATRNI